PVRGSIPRPAERAAAADHTASACNLPPPAYSTFRSRPVGEWCLVRETGKPRTKHQTHISRPEGGKRSGSGRAAGPPAAAGFPGPRPRPRPPCRPRVACRFRPRRSGRFVCTKWRAYIVGSWRSQAALLHNSDTPAGWPRPGCVSCPRILPAPLRVAATRVSPMSGELLVPIAAILAGVLAWFFPGLLRPVWWVLARLMYRFHGSGREHVPTSGGCLIVCNHVSSIDWLVLRAACPRRLTIAKEDDPQAVADALDAGRAVLVFPECRLTRSGQMLPFGRVVERILERTSSDVPVIPACTDGLWGSVFSHEGGRIIWKGPKALRPHVAVMFGQPITKTLPSPEIRLAVQETSAECAIRQSDFVRPVHRAFVRNAVKFRNIFRKCVVDNAAGEKILTY